MISSLSLVQYHHSLICCLESNQIIPPTLIREIVINPYRMMMAHDNLTFREKIRSYLEDFWQLNYHRGQIPLPFLSNQDIHLFAQNFVETPPEYEINFYQSLKDWLVTNLEDKEDFEEKWSDIFLHLSAEEKNIFIRMLFLVNSYEVWREDHKILFFKEMGVFFRRIYENKELESFFSLEPFIKLLTVQILEAVFSQDTLDHFLPSVRAHFREYQNFFKKDDIHRDFNIDIFWAKLKISQDRLLICAPTENIPQENKDEHLLYTLRNFFKAHIEDMKSLLIFLKSFFDIDSEMLSAEMRYRFLELDEDTVAHQNLMIHRAFFVLQEKIHAESRGRAPYFLACTKLETFFNSPDIKEDFFVDALVEQLINHLYLINSETESYFVSYIQKHYFSFSVADLRVLERMFEYCFRHHLALLTVEIFQIIVSPYRENKINRQIESLDSPYILVRFLSIACDKKESFFRYLKNHYTKEEQKRIIEWTLNYQSGKYVSDGMALCNFLKLKKISFREPERLKYFFHYLDLEDFSEPSDFINLLKFIFQKIGLQNPQYEEMFLIKVALKLRRVSANQILGYFERKDEILDVIKTYCTEKMSWLFSYALCLEVCMKNIGSIHADQEIMHFFIDEFSSYQHFFEERNLFLVLFFQWSTTEKFHELRNLMALMQKKNQSELIGLNMELAIKKLSYHIKMSTSLNSSSHKRKYKRLVNDILTLAFEHLPILDNLELELFKILEMIFLDAQEEENLFNPDLALVYYIFHLDWDQRKDFLEKIKKQHLEIFVDSHLAEKIAIYPRGKIFIYHLLLNLMSRGALCEVSDLDFLEVLKDAKSEAGFTSLSQKFLNSEFSLLLRSNRTELVDGENQQKQQGIVFSLPKKSNKRSIEEHLEQNDTPKNKKNKI